MRKTAFWLSVVIATLWLSLGLALAQPLPQTTVQILVNRDDVNIRISPALGAEVIGFVDAGWTAYANARSPDNQWVRIDFNGQEGWVGVPVINLFGDISTLPVADPRSIPYGGFESPRSGPSSATSPYSGRLADSGVRLRAGPSTAYPVLANIPRYTVFPLTGRTLNNAWVQVNYEGTLGWITAAWVEFQNGASIVQLPVDGVVANSPPASEETQENYFGVLRLMLDRLDLSQVALDSIRGTWTTVALGQRSACQNFPARPTDILIAQPLLAAFYPTLEPLRVDFNSAMANLRLAIDLWIEACGQPSPPSGVVGEATVIGALNAIQAADGLFADLRRRLSALLPSDVTLDADECLFTFEEQFDILKIITKGNVVLDTLTPRKTATGYCFDANAGESIRVEFLPYSGNISALLSVSPFDNPTQFLGVGRSSATGSLLTVGPINITATGRYLLVIAHTSSEPVQGNYALMVTNIAGLAFAGPTLGIDPNTGQVVVNPPTSLTPLPGSFITPVPGFEVTPTVSSSGLAVCPSLAFTCQQLTSCAEAQACLQAGNFSLDPDNDRIPCEETLCR